MNLLELYIAEQKRKTFALGQSTEIEAMNALQSAGIVSDECVIAVDVHQADQQRAIDFLKTRPNESN